MARAQQKADPGLFQKGLDRPWYRLLRSDWEIPSLVFSSACHKIESFFLLQWPLCKVRQNTDCLCHIAKLGSLSQRTDWTLLKNAHSLEEHCRCFQMQPVHHSCRHCRMSVTVFECHGAFRHFHYLQWWDSSKRRLLFRCVLPYLCTSAVRKVHEVFKFCLRTALPKLSNCQRWLDQENPKRASPQTATVRPSDLSAGYILQQSGYLLWVQEFSSLPFNLSSLWRDPYECII